MEWICFADAFILNDYMLSYYITCNESYMLRCASRVLFHDKEMIFGSHEYKIIVPTRWLLRTTIHKYIYTVPQQDPSLSDTHYSHSHIKCTTSIN